MRKIFNCNTKTVEELLDLEPISDSFLSDVVKSDAIAELNNLDIASIRAMREYIASQPDAPKILKDRELLAQQTRVKLR